MKPRTRVGLLAEVQDLLARGEVQAAYEASCMAVLSYPDDPVAQRLYAEAATRLDDPQARSNPTPVDLTPADLTPLTGRSHAPGIVMVGGALAIITGALAWWVTDTAPARQGVFVGHPALAALSIVIGILAILTGGVVWARVSRAARMVGGISGLAASSLAVVALVLMVRNDIATIHPVATAPSRMYGPFIWGIQGMYWMLIGGLVVWHGSRIERDEA